MLKASINYKSNMTATDNLNTNKKTIKTTQTRGFSSFQMELVMGLEPATC